MVVSSLGNKISIIGEINANECSRLLAAMHNEVYIRGYQDIYLDFSECTKAFSPEMVAVCMRCQQYWKEGIDISLTLPTNQTLSNLFKNANWANLIDIRKYEPSRFRGTTHVPTLRFSNAREQNEAVNKILEILLIALQNFQRKDLTAIEWVLNEITDNVINHSQSAVGGLVQVTNFRNQSQIEFVVCDAGIGVPNSLRPSRPDLTNDIEALDAAIREGVTRDKSVGQGNGLYGTWEVSKKSLGSFRLLSGYAGLESTERKGLQINPRDIPFAGTLIMCRIGYATNIDLVEALAFGGKKHTPVDYIDTHFQANEDGLIVFDLADESEGFGSRAAGDPVRRKLLNLLNFKGINKVVVDLDRVMLVSSSYADEVFGKLFLELGPLDFSERIEMKNINELVRALINKAILQRIRQ